MSESTKMDCSCESNIGCPICYPQNFLPKTPFQYEGEKCIIIAEGWNNIKLYRLVEVAPMRFHLKDNRFYVIEGEDSASR